MSRHLYNPFMPSTDFASRMARGGGGGGPAPAPAPRYTSPYPELEGQTYPSQAERDRAEGIINNRRAEAKAAAEKAAAEAAERQRKYEAAKKAADEKRAAEQAAAEQAAMEEEARRVAATTARPVGFDELPDLVVTNPYQDAQTMRRTSLPAATPAPTTVDAAAGTMSKASQTAGTDAMLGQVDFRPNYTGTTMRNLTSPSQGQGSVLQVPYSNDMGQTLMVTETNGFPSTYVPPGFSRTQPEVEEIPKDPRYYYDDGSPKQIDGVTQFPPMPLPEGGDTTGSFWTGAKDAFSDFGKDKFGPVLGQAFFSEGGTVEDLQLEGMYRMATKFLGYEGPKTREAMEAFQQSSPAVASKMQGYMKAATKAMAKGGAVTRGFAEGGFNPADLGKMQAAAVQQTMQPRQSTVTQLTPDAADFISPTAGQTTPIAPMAQAATVDTTALAQQPIATPAAQVAPATSYLQVQAETDATQAAQGQVTQQAQVDAAQQQESSVSNLQAAQGQAIMMDNPVQREIQQGELISGAADAQKAAQFTEQVQAAEATPTKQATVAGQLEGLMAQFEGGETPAWAAGSMRTAMATLSARGLGASSLAGQAVVQAAMESALPIAQMDAQTQAQFETQNLSNRQQRAMLAAQQRASFLGQEFDQEFQARVQNSARIGDIANMNFTAEQQVALENSRAANTMELNNLSNRQAKVLAEASALANMDLSNLNNRQQAAVQNAQSFLQVDMTNLSNEQQTAMFKAQQNVQALFTDQAATNAASQFNATNENQTNQFFANLSNQTSQFNAAQSNAMDQFNVNSVNALREFNAEIQQQRDLFNAQNGLVVAQSNAQWRQNIATVNTAAQNQSNMEFAKTMNALTASNMDQIWQRERDLMSFAFASAEGAADRATQIGIAKLTAAEQAALQDNIGKGKLTAIALEAVLGEWL